MNAPAAVRVPGYEALAWSGPHVSVHEDPRGQRARLAGLGEEDALIVYATRVHTKDVLWSRRLRGAFTRWPPDVDPAVEHQTGDFCNLTSGLMAWPNGSFAVRTQEGTIVARVGEPGATWSFKGFACFEPAPLEGMYLFTHENGETRVTHRSRRSEEAHVTPCGVVPSAHHQIVTELGTLLLAVLDKKGSCQLVVATRAGLRKAAKLKGSEHAQCSLLPRRGGGAFVVLHQRMGDVAVQRVDEEGQAVGERFTLAGPHNVYAACSWRDGFALQMRNGDGLGAVVSDGVHVTLAAAAPLGRMQGPHGREGALLSSPDGSVILFGYDCMAGPSVGRLVAGDASVVQRAEPVALAPAPTFTRVEPAPPPQAPRRAAPKFGTRDELVERMRGAAVMGHLLGVGGPSTAFEGDRLRGTFQEDDGQGNHCVVVWDETGLVALGFDHDSPESEWRVALDLRNPGKHLSRIPASLAALAERATDVGERLATEGYWVEAGDHPLSGATSGDVLERLLPGDPCCGEPALDALVARIVGAPSHEITRDESSVLFAHGAEGGRDVQERMERRLEGLTKLGITWPGAREHARAKADELAAARAARLTPADRALLHAASDGDLAAAERALGMGANVDVRMPEDELPFTPAHCTPLIVALRCDRLEVARFLIEAGADVNAASAAAWGGRETALRLAAAQGNLELTRALLARGADVRLEGSSWGLLQQTAYPRDHLRRGSPSDYAEVLRLLLDAGAPLPNDAHCAMLCALGEAGGPELAARLRRVHAEDALPAEPEPIDVEAHAARVSELLARASSTFVRDTVETLGLLVEAWRLNLHPRIADAAEGLAKMIRGARAPLATGSRPTDGAKLLADVRSLREGPIDPRAARTILAWLWTNDIYTSKAAIAQAEDEAAAVLVMLRDVRFTESLAQLCEHGRPISSVPARASLKMALRVMREARHGALSEADVDALGAIEDHLANRKPSGLRPTIRDLFAAVHAAPDADEPRRALASRLVEAGDPRGEFIQLQMTRRAGKITKREKELQKEHGRAWLGDLGRVLEDSVVFERGFPVQAAIVGATSNDWHYVVLPSGAGTQPEWSTIRRLELAGRESPGLLRGSRTQGLTELRNVGAGDLAALLDGDARPSLERLELAVARSPHVSGLDASLLAPLQDKLPSLVALHVKLAERDLAAIERVTARLPLRELAIGAGHPLPTKRAERAELAELFAFARRRALTKVLLLGFVDFAFTLASGLLEISFHGPMHPSQERFVAASLANARDLGIARIVLQLPPRAKLVTDADGRPTRIERRSEKLGLAAIFEAAAAAGAGCDIEPPG